MTKRRAEERAVRERREMNLAPWQLAPSEVEDGPSPYPAGTAGAASWAEAQRWRVEIRARDPGYFAGDDACPRGARTDAG